MADLVARRNLMILAILARAETNQYTLDEISIQEDLESAGFPVDPTVLRAGFRHLRDHDCVVVDTSAGVWVVTLTRSGLATSKGTRPVEGVAKPVPSM